MVWRFFFSDIVLGLVCVCRVRAVTGGSESATLQTSTNQKLCTPQDSSRGPFPTLDLNSDSVHAPCEKNAKKFWLVVQVFFFVNSFPMFGNRLLNNARPPLPVTTSASSLSHPSLSQLSTLNRLLSLYLSQQLRRRNLLSASCRTPHSRAFSSAPHPPPPAAAAQLLHSVHEPAAFTSAAPTAPTPPHRTRRRRRARTTTTPPRCRPAPPGGRPNRQGPSCSGTS